MTRVAVKLRVWEIVLFTYRSLRLFSYNMTIKRQAADNCLDF